MSILEVSNVSKSFGGVKANVDISMTVEKGKIFGLIGYIDSTDVAFDGREMGVFMVLMAILGGKGTLWGPVIGATLFHFFKEGLWTLILGWQYVALGVLIVVIVVYFPEGLMGWLREKYPERFGEVIDDKDRKAQVELK